MSCRRRQLVLSVVATVLALTVLLPSSTEDTAAPPSTSAPRHNEAPSTSTAPAEAISFKTNRVKGEMPLFGRVAESMPFFGHVSDSGALAAVASAVVNCSVKNMSSAPDFDVNECTAPSGVEYCVEGPSGNTCNDVVHVILRVRPLTTYFPRTTSHHGETDRWIKQVVGPLNINAVGTIEGQWIISGFSVFRPAVGDYIVLFPVLAAVADTLSQARLGIRLKVVQRDFDGVDEVLPTTRRVWSHYVIPKDMSVLVPGSVAAGRRKVTLQLTKPSLLFAWRVKGGGKLVSALRGGNLQYQQMSPALSEEGKTMQHAPCLYNKSIVVTGDSQSRSLYWALKDALGGSVAHTGPASYDVKDASGSKLTQASSAFAGGVRLRYSWDNYLENISTVARGEGGDVVVFGMGAHAASWGQWSFVRFHKEMHRVAEALCAPKVNARQRLVWYGAPAWPKHKPNEKFRATNLRLGLFNAIAEHVLYSVCGQKKALQAVDFFHMTYPVLHLSKDGAHYDKSVVAPTMANAVAKALCND